MTDKAKAKQKSALRAKRHAAFAKTLTQGASKDYMKYLKQESAENRIIERNL